MTRNFLLEIGLEEMPAHVVTPSVKELQAKVAQFLKEERISYDRIKPFSTPRRLALEIDGLVAKQPDIDEEVKGPAKKIAQTEDGQWSKAAIGFTKGQGVTTDEITFKNVKGTDYVFVNKHVAGKPVSEVLLGLVDVIKSMNFPTMMKWGTHHFQFVRPIKWMVALLDDEVLPLEIVDVKAGRTTQGHRFLGQPVELKTVADYEPLLKEQFVLVDAKERKQRIKDQIAAIAKEHDWQIPVDDELLEEVNNLVEWPTSFAGDFDERFLAIPREVLITSMRDHQRFFFVEDQAGNLLPHFVSVRNGNADHLDNVIAGNEKVLAARLYDAEFFYQEDQQHDIDYFVNKMKDVTFHDQISSMYDKMQRVQVIAKLIGEQVGLNAIQLAHLQRAAEIYKFDLVTGMVGEFAELQGIMGEKYALLQGEDPEVAQAIREHYEPIAADGELPASKVGAVLAVADKLDSILTFFAAGMIPSGSNDPYALRRQATGIVRIVTKEQWTLPILPLLQLIVKKEQATDVLPKVDQAPVFKPVVEFLKDRIKKELKDAGVRYDLVNAAVDATNTDINYNEQSAHVLQTNADQADFKAVIEALTRVTRIATKADSDVDAQTVDPSLFENDSEQQLYDAVQKLQADFVSQSAEQAYVALAKLQPLIDAYFDATMVMSENPVVRDNRLAELTQLSALIMHFADVEAVMVK
ncbi:glycine--tRNA ligase subunit beta [Fructilactobacillus cliffordii]|uniref:Glycine--tRNA ligase beta subunit n=1 Tax=Fructilactobacillus cliffordii TaxID=2940299 RepID=A0A9Q8ZUM5_9LACO|nr:glycine--tRNA ligase subunit beta [Fructilactobacillus cliffordii]USS89598.1 glycine--tRNA ligase subunit beta [Fructilactobacillus cliffordii]